nr:MAG TPA: hypothetical protein [Caudoviricetes sp.]
MCHQGGEAYHQEVHTLDYTQIPFKSYRKPFKFDLRKKSECKCA